MSQCEPVRAPIEHVYYQLARRVRRDTNAFIRSPNELLHQPLLVSHNNSRLLHDLNFSFRGQCGCALPRPALPCPALHWPSPIPRVALQPSAAAVGRAAPWSLGTSRAGLGWAACPAPAPALRPPPTTTTTTTTKRAVGRNAPTQLKPSKSRNCFTK